MANGKGIDYTNKFGHWLMEYIADTRGGTANVTMLKYTDAKGAKLGYTMRKAPVRSKEM